MRHVKSRCVQVEEEVTEEEKEKRSKKEAAQKEKELGNTAYKARRFEEAIEHYNRAMELDDTDVSFLLNRYKDCSACVISLFG